MADSENLGWADSRGTVGTLGRFGRARLNVFFSVPWIHNVKGILFYIYIYIYIAECMGVRVPGAITPRIRH